MSNSFKKYFLKKYLNLTLYSNRIYTKKVKSGDDLPPPLPPKGKSKSPALHVSPFVFCFVFVLYFIFIPIYLFYFISLFYFNHTFCCAWYFCYTYIPQDFPQTEPRELTDQVISSIDTPQYKVFEKKKVWLPKKLATSVLTEFYSEKLYFVWKKCYDLLGEKIVLVIEKNF